MKIVLGKALPNLELDLDTVDLGEAQKLLNRDGQIIETPNRLYVEKIEAAASQPKPEHRRI
jgi:hypothetical protein